MVRGVVARLLSKIMLVVLFFLMAFAMSCINWDKTVFRCNTDSDCPAGQTCDLSIHWCSPPHDVVIRDIRLDTPDTKDLSLDHRKGLDQMETE